MKVTGHGMNCAGEGIANEDNGPDAMFSLAAMKGVRSAQKVAEAAVPDDAEAAAAESSSESSDGDDGASSSDEDSDDARRWDPVSRAVQRVWTAEEEGYRESEIFSLFPLSVDLLNGYLVAGLCIVKACTNPTLISSSLRENLVKT